MAYSYSLSFIMALVMAMVNQLHVCTCMWVCFILGCETVSNTLAPWTRIDNEDTMSLNNDFNELVSQTVTA